MGGGGGEPPHQTNADQAILNYEVANGPEGSRLGLQFGSG